MLIYVLRSGHRLKIRLLIMQSVSVFMVNQEAFREIAVRFLPYYNRSQFPDARSRRLHPCPFNSPVCSDIYGSDSIPIFGARPWFKFGFRGQSDRDPLIPRFLSLGKRVGWTQALSPLIPDLMRMGCRVFTEYPYSLAPLGAEFRGLSAVVPYMKIFSAFIALDSNHNSIIPCRNYGSSLMLLEEQL